MSDVRTWTSARLLATPVVDAHGTELGWVCDVRLVPRGTSLEATGVVVGRRMLAERLGYGSGVIAGPRLLTAWLQRRHSHLRWVPWDQVDRLDQGQLHLAVAAEELAPLPEVAR